MRASSQRLKTKALSTASTALLSGSSAVIYSLPSIFYFPVPAHRTGFVAPCGLWEGNQRKKKG